MPHTAAAAEDLDGDREGVVDALGLVDGRRGADAEEPAEPVLGEDDLNARGGEVVDDGAGARERRQMRLRSSGVSFSRRRATARSATCSGVDGEGEAPAEGRVTGRMEPPEGDGVTGARLEDAPREMELSAHCFGAGSSGRSSLISDRALRHFDPPYRRAELKKTVS
jgi:hypothetical protein